MPTSLAVFWGEALWDKVGAADARRAGINDLRLHGQPQASAGAEAAARSSRRPTG